MKKNLLYCFCIILLASCGEQQSYTEEKKVIDSVSSQSITPVITNQISSFIPTGYEINDSCKGDLNKDDYTDMILILKHIKEDSLLRDAGQDVIRPLIILVGTPNNEFKFVNRYDSIVYSAMSYIDGAFNSCKIKNGYFSIEQGVMGGPQHWEDIVTFKYDTSKQNWYLYKRGGMHYSQNPSTDENAEAMIQHTHKTKTAKDFGIIPLEKFNINKEE
jgi:hypothetical protein